MITRLTLAAVISVAATSAFAGPTVTPNAPAITAVTPVPLAETQAASAATSQQAAPSQPAQVQAPARSAFIANYVASFGR